MVGVALLLLTASAVPLRGELLAPSAAGLSGSLAVDYFSSNHGIDDRRHFPGVNGVLKHRWTLADGVRWVGEARVLAQQVGHEDDDAPHASIRDLRYADEVVSELREGYVEITRSDWELTLGRRIVVWGRADEINPTDVLSPKNYLLLLPEGVSGYRFGTNTVQLDYFVGRHVRLTGIWLPITSPSLIPLSDPPPGIRVVSRPPAVRLENGIAGVKLDRSGGGVDASVAYVYGYNLLPEVRLRSFDADAETGAVRGTVALEHARQHMIGVDFATTWGRLGLRGELAYVHTDNPNGRRLDGVTPHLFYVLGLERSLPASVSLIVQYVGRWVRNRVDPARALDDADPARGQARFLAARETFVINQQLDTVQNGWSVRLDKKFWNDTLDCELLGVHYLERNDFFVRPRITYDLLDGWRTAVGAEIFGGPSTSFFGRVKQNRGVFLEMLYSF